MFRADVTYYDPATKKAAFAEFTAHTEALARHQCLRLVHSVGAQGYKIECHLVEHLHNDEVGVSNDWLDLNIPPIPATPSF